MYKISYKQIKMDKISPIKERILQFIESQGITKTDFCKNTNISYSNLKGRSLFSEIGGEQIGHILNYYSEISPIWLLLGQGSMLKEEKATYYAQGNLVGGNLTQGSETTTVANSSLDKNNEQILEILQKELELKNKIIAKLMGLEEK